jgi:hypothetical protein
LGGGMATQHERKEEETKEKKEKKENKNYCRGRPTSSKKTTTRAGSSRVLAAHERISPLI